MNKDGKNILNKCLLIFFKDALKVAIKSPSQAFSFFRTLLWLGQAAKRRKSWLAQGIPVSPILIFSITNRCNLRCAGCYAQSFHEINEDRLSAEKMRNIIHESAELGVSFFVISGGEPFMRPELLEITKAYPQIIFLIFTNGLLIDDTMIAVLRSQKNVVPLVSLEGSENDTDDRRGAGTHQMLHEIMGKMHQAGIFFGNALTLTTNNFSTILDDQYVKNLVNAGCKFFLFIEYTPTAEGTENWILNFEQRSRVPGLMDIFRSKYPALFIAVPWDEDDVGGCLSAGRGFIHINANGDVEPCPFAPFSNSNLNNISLKEAFKSKFFEAIRQVPELSRETGGGCVLWKERELVQSILQNHAKVNNAIQPNG
jgi:MoaA/NifB/PqqE/SkfB family radical SAM enzyme